MGRDEAAHPLARPEVAAGAQVRNSVAIFSSRESPATLQATTEAAIRAVGERGLVDVVVNGNRLLASAFAELTPKLQTMCEEHGAVVRTWFVLCGDKAHAWNTYLHELWPQSEIAFFVDGYARVRGNACALLRQAMLDEPEAMAATGIPTCGRTASHLAAQMLREGGMHGNFYAVKRETMSALRSRGFRLPLGMYRTDSTLGAVLSFRLNPSQYEWDPKQIIVHPAATWDIDERAWWDPAAMLSHYRRLLRQGQGVLENLAVRDHLAVRRQAPETMPETVAELVLEWAARSPGQARRAARFSYPVSRALRELAVPRDWSATNVPPEMLAQNRGRG